MQIDVPYGITRRLTNITIDEARTRTTRALGAEGFGVLTEIDVKSTLKKKLDVDTAPYLILGACNPHLAHAALQIEPAIGLLLPCNVVLAQDGADVLVSAASPRAMFSVVEAKGGIEAIAVEAEARLRRALEEI